MYLRVPAERSVGNGQILNGGFFRTPKYRVSVQRRQTKIRQTIFYVAAEII